MWDNLVVSERWIVDSIKNKKDEIKKKNKRLNKEGKEEDGFPFSWEWQNGGWE